MPNYELGFWVKILYISFPNEFEGLLLNPRLYIVNDYRFYLVRGKVVMLYRLKRNLPVLSLVLFQITKLLLIIPKPRPRSPIHLPQAICL